MPTNASRLLDIAGGTVPAEHVNLMWSTLVTGLVVVFLILIILVAFLWIMGKLLNIKIKKKPKQEKAAPVAKEVKPAAVPAAPVAEAEEYYDEDDSEIIAVIAAAIAAYGEADGKQYRIASVKRREKSLRSNWGAAGVNENMRRF